jgi:hypothetical protein
MLLFIYRVFLVFLYDTNTFKMIVKFQKTDTAKIGKNAASDIYLHGNTNLIIKRRKHGMLNVKKGSYNLKNYFL